MAALSDDESTLTTSSAASSSTSAARERHNVPSIPFPRTIPDLRFEQSYLATIRNFIHEYDDDGQAHDLKAEHIENREDHKGGPDAGRGFDEKQEDSAADKEHQQREQADIERKADKRVTRTRSAGGEPEIWLGKLRVEWPSLLYVTARDQLLSPFVQGTLWSVAGMLFAGFRAYQYASRSPSSSSSLFSSMLRGGRR